MHLESSVSPIVLKHVADTHGIPPFDISAELALFLLQPNKQMREEVQRAKARVDWINLRRPILAVRVARLQRRQAVTSSEVKLLFGFFEIGNVLWLRLLTAEWLVVCANKMALRRCAWKIISTSELFMSAHHARFILKLD